MQLFINFPVFVSNQHTPYVVTTCVSFIWNSQFPACQ